MTTPAPYHRTVPYDAARPGDRYLQPHHGHPYSGAVELAAEREPMVWIPAPGQNFIAVPRSTLPPGYLNPAPLTAQPPTLRAEPLIDRRAQVLAAGGVCAAGVGFGLGQVISAAAGAGGGVILALAALLLALRAPMTGPAHRPGDTYVTHNHQHITARGFLGRASGAITTHNGR
jgi:hypothetical protein